MNSVDTQDNVEDVLISIIVSCYNHGKYLTESVESLLSQTYKNIQIIIVNDGSTDNTSEIMHSLKEDHSAIDIIDIPTNKGKWNALNTGIMFASGKVVTSQDADDVALPDRIERQYRCLVETNTNHNLCGFYHCWSEEDVSACCNNRVSGDLETLDPRLVHHLVMQGYGHPAINHYFTGEFETAGVSAMFYRDIWSLGMRFNPPEMQLRTLNSEDSDFNFRMTAVLGNTSVLREKLYCYRRGTSTNNEKK
jgi:glycosyltransferase involved in cell wall biosynthesis